MTAADPEDLRAAIRRDAFADEAATVGRLVGAGMLLDRCESLYPQFAIHNAHLEPQPSNISCPSTRLE